MEKNTNIRAFLAVKITPDLKNSIQKVQHDLQSQISGLRWSRVDNIHLTLKFLGDTPDTAVTPIINDIEKQIDQIPCFHVNRPRILWLGSQHTPKEYHDLLDLLEAIMIRFGFAKEQKKRIPHLTIGRIKKLKKRELLSTIANQYKLENVLELKVNRIVFFKSVLKPQGPEYTALAHFNLNSNGGLS